LWVEHDASVLPDDPEAWYDHQLTGLRAVRDGVDVGTIARVEHFPAQDLLVVKTADGEVMVPFVKAIVPEVNMTTGIVTLTPPMGLFEELEDDDSELLATTAPPRAEQDDDENSAKGSTEA
jgi:16S rRNA processing protein RimM